MAKRKKRTSTPRYRGSKKLSDYTRSYSLRLLNNAYQKYLNVVDKLQQLDFPYIRGNNPLITMEPREVKNVINIIKKRTKINKYDEYSNKFFRNLINVSFNYEDYSKQVVTMEFNNYLKNLEDINKKYGISSTKFIRKMRRLSLGDKMRFLNSQYAIGIYDYPSDGKNDLGKYIETFGENPLETRLKDFFNMS